MNFLRDVKVEQDTVCVMKSSDDHTYYLNPSAEPSEVVDYYSEGCQSIKFQEGYIKESGINGITEASLIQVLIDRFESYQKGSFPCVCNERILDDLYCLICKINTCTRNKIAQNDEGKNEK